MSRHDFPPEEFACRRQRARAALGAAGLDWFVAVHPASIHWLTGAQAKSYQSFQCLLVPAGEAPLVMFTREAERNEFQDDALFDELFTWGGAGPQDPFEIFAPLARRFGLANSRIAIEAPDYYLSVDQHARLRACLGGDRMETATSLIHDLRLIKSQREIEYVRKANRIADLSMAAFRDALRPGRSESELAAEIYRTILSSGGGQPASPVNLVSGPRAALSHGGPTDRRLQQGDFGNVEYGAPYRCYTVSIGRQFAIGRPTPRMMELHEIACLASDACISEIADGVPASTPFEAARQIIAEAGLDRQRVHTVGYGVAPAFPPSSGERMHLSAGSGYTLRAGMQISICPPIFIGEERLGARIVDNVLVTATGAEVLSSFPRDLIVIC